LCFYQKFSCKINPYFKTYRITQISIVNSPPKSSESANIFVNSFYTAQVRLAIKRAPKSSIATHSPLTHRPLSPPLKVSCHMLQAPPTFSHAHTHRTPPKFVARIGQSQSFGDALLKTSLEVWLPTA